MGFGRRRAASGCEQQRLAEWLAGGPVPDEQQMQRLLAHCPEWYRRLAADADAEAVKTRAKRAAEELSTTASEEEEPLTSTTSKPLRGTVKSDKGKGNSSRRPTQSLAGASRTPRQPARVSTASAELRGGSTYACALAVLCCAVLLFTSKSAEQSRAAAALSERAHATRATAPPPRAQSTLLYCRVVSRATHTHTHSEKRSEANGGGGGGGECAHLLCSARTERTPAVLCCAVRCVQ